LFHLLDQPQPCPFTLKYVGIHHLEVETTKKAAEGSAAFSILKE